MCELFLSFSTLRALSPCLNQLLIKIESVALIPVFGGAYNSLCVCYYMYKHTMYLFWEVDNIFAIYAP